MRGLTSEERDLLHHFAAQEGECVGCEEEDEYGEDDFSADVVDTLVQRRCLIEYRCHTGVDVRHYTITRLGRLALEVADTVKSFTE
jgi:hypothetical protein